MPPHDLAQCLLECSQIQTPLRRRARGRLWAGFPGCNCSRNHMRSCAKDKGAVPRSGRRGIPRIPLGDSNALCSRLCSNACFAGERPDRGRGDSGRIVILELEYPQLRCSHCAARAFIAESIVATACYSSNDSLAIGPRWECATLRGSPSCTLILGLAPFQYRCSSAQPELAYEMTQLGHQGRRWSHGCPGTRVPLLQERPVCTNPIEDSR